MTLILQTLPLRRPNRSRFQIQRTSKLNRSALNHCDVSVVSTLPSTDLEAILEAISLSLCDLKSLRFDSDLRFGHLRLVLITGSEHGFVYSSKR